MKRNFSRAASSIEKECIDIILREKADKMENEIIKSCNIFIRNIYNLPLEDFLIYATINKDPYCYKHGIPPAVYLAFKLQYTKDLKLNQNDIVGYYIGKPLEYQKDNQNPSNLSIKNDIQDKNLKDLIMKYPQYRNLCIVGDPNPIDYEYYMEKEIYSSLEKLLGVIKEIDLSKIRRIFCKESTKNEKYTSFYPRYTENKKRYYDKDGNFIVEIHHKDEYIQNKINLSDVFRIKCCKETDTYYKPKKQCKICEKDLNKFYLEKLHTFMHRIQQDLFSQPRICKKCAISHPYYISSCVECSEDISFKDNGSVFENILKSIEVFFENSELNEVKDVLKTYSRISSYREIDLSLYFNSEMNIKY